jgi:hypothetical protein
MSAFVFREEVLLLVRVVLKCKDETISRCSKHNERHPRRCRRQRSLAEILLVETTVVQFVVFELCEIKTSSKKRSTKMRNRNF